MGHRVDVRFGMEAGLCGKYGGLPIGYQDGVIKGRSRIISEVLEFKLVTKCCLVTLINVHLR